MTKKGARRAAVIAMMMVAFPFVGLSVWQLATAVFGAHARQDVATASDLACAAKLRVLAAAIERAGDKAGHAPDEATATAVFSEAVAPEWNDSSAIEQACIATPRGRDAWSALLRLRRTLEGRSQKDAREVGPVRRDFETRLP